jgi:Spy/CpxP family protein refolding chaperone
MKRWMILTCALLILVVAGIAVVRAAPLRRHHWCNHGWQQHGPLGYIAHELKLSAVQKSQISSIWRGEKPTVVSLIREFVAEGKEMDSITAENAFDDRKTQSIADRQAATVAKLLVEHEKLKWKIYTTVLTPEQRTKANELQERWRRRVDQMIEGLDHAAN